MYWSVWIRQFHRWMAVIFTVVVAGIFITLGVGSEPPMWAYYLPLAPLAMLMLSGLYMYLLPYAIKWRGAKRTNA
ncbi:hypothetical protein [Pelagibacterium xiamenense]|uniref:hypothetical protein n=1 Tax=Pelagibacterium xiamenense TaxID=2901140 RepID=UPI001E58872C|nr:hypothetical protein [Pelagibacterium xiamenense]MCD7061171.1 hypothetical protein [Pelagibacterium xiamenense]